MNLIDGAWENKVTAGLLKDAECLFSFFLIKEELLAA